MSIKFMPCVSVRCNKCDCGYDEFYTTPKEEMEILKQQGWTGTYKKCFCPKCSQEINNEKINKS